MTIRVLLADDDASLRLVLQQAFGREDFNVRATGNLATLSKWVREGEGDVVVSDVYLGEDCLFDALPDLRRARPDLPFIVMSAQSHVMTALSAVDRGAYEYLPKPFDLDVMIDASRRAVSRRPDPKARAQAGLAQKDAKLPLVGRSQVMQDVYRLLARVTNVDLSIVLEGEHGVGKASVARAMHQHGPRKDGPFQRLSVSGLEAHSLDSVFLGEGGAFARAKGGVLFLDDVDELSPAVQAALFRVLDAAEDRAIDVRIVAASSRPFLRLMLEGEFRQDLHYRLAQVTIPIPPLRQRQEDIGDLARAHLVRLRSEGLAERSLDSTAIEALKGYDWPGNVRELENFLRRLVVLRPEAVLTAREINEELNGLRAAVREPGESGETLETVIRRQLDLEYSERLPDNLYEKALPAFERPLIARVLAATDGNQIRAASILGINRNTLRKKIQQLGLSTARRN
jgi:two-component system nitrogen regulation response regulator GlnG